MNCILHFNKEIIIKIHLLIIIIVLHILKKSRGKIRINKIIKNQRE